MLCLVVSEDGMNTSRVVFKHTAITQIKQIFILLDVHHLHFSCVFNISFAIRFAALGFIAFQVDYISCISSHV